MEWPRESLQETATLAKAHNGWFTEESIKMAIEGIVYMLQKDKLESWLESYTLETRTPKKVGIVMAGNIPLVGFHDLLCVLLSGHTAAIKLSQKDEMLMKEIINKINKLEPRFRERLEIRDTLSSVDAVIATGSDNTARYFEYYFRNIPHIIRKNRSSVAILTGDESETAIKRLGADIFSFFGLGCRNVSKIYTPEHFDLRSIFPLWQGFEEIIHHHKYKNNYDYYKSIFLVNREPHLDTGYVLVKSVSDLVSPTSVLYHQTYPSKEELEELLVLQKDKIQCVVGNDHIPFGKAQKPEPWDYADGVDTLRFLDQL
jgi:hypothetical protein